MKKFTPFYALVLGLVAFAGLSFTTFSVLNSSISVDTANSSIQWKGYKVTGQHNGVVNIKNGNLAFDTKGMLSGGSFDIDMTSITVLDLTGDMKGKLEGHLKSPDFFGVEKYPIAKFVITKVVSRGKPGEYKIVGNLTIKESTKEIKFDANLTEEGSKVTATGNVRIDRSDYDIRYGSGSFFDGLGDKTIYDDFDLSIKLVAKK